MAAEKELDHVGPRIVAAVGSTAALAPAGNALPIITVWGAAEFGGRRG